MSKLGFKPALKDTLAANAKAMDGMAKLYGVNAEGQRHINEMQAEVAARTAKAAARKPRTLYAGASEAEVQKAVIQFLLLHPRVAMVERINSGAVYGAENQFIRFHTLMLPARFKHIRMKVADLSVTLTDSRRMAVECKRGDWVKPSNEREFEQAAYLAHIKSLGGIGIFANSIDAVADALSGAS